jgi:hypothetical protein
VEPTAVAVIGAAGPDQRTPEIRAVVQEVVSRPNWSAGNALAIIITGTGHRTAKPTTAFAPPLHSSTWSTSSALDGRRERQTSAAQHLLHCSIYVLQIDER